ncbi:MAG: histidine triad nucleotide-binding protein [Clostridia bacterium]|nr:histidine triad nucleotide-binding protein [Clostridia bacterium]
MDDCLFCKFVSKEFETKIVYEDKDMIIINDINPKAPVHMLLIPKVHYKYLHEQNEKSAELLGRCLRKLASLRCELGLDDGYRLVINQGDDAGQTVPHLHVHILAGKKMDWNPA